jgi:hypothetical protein
MALPAIAAMAAMTVLPMVLGGKPQQPGSPDMPANVGAAALRGQQNAAGEGLGTGGASFGGDNQQSSMLNAVASQEREQGGQSPYLAAALRGDNRTSLDEWRGG